MAPLARLASARYCCRMLPRRARTQRLSVRGATCALSSLSSSPKDNVVILRAADCGRWVSLQHGTVQRAPVFDFAIQRAADLVPHECPFHRPDDRDRFRVAQLINEIGIVPDNAAVLDRSCIADDEKG